jgi:osmotically-inducible protein OsmY
MGKERTMQDRDYDRDRTGRTDFERSSSTYEGGNPAYGRARFRSDRGAQESWQDRGYDDRAAAYRGDRGEWDDRSGQYGGAGRGDVRYGRQDIDRGTTGSRYIQDWQSGPDDDIYERGGTGRQYGQNWQGRAGASGSMRGIDDDYTQGQTYGGQQPYGRGRYGGDAPVAAFSYTEYWLVPGPHSGKGPRGYQRSDERIREEIGDRLTRHGQIDASDIEVQVANGEVTLAGTTTDRRQKRLAEDVAEDVPGVRDVHNQI